MVFSGKKSKRLSGWTRVLFLLCFVWELGMGAKAFEMHNVPVTVYAAEAEDDETDVMKKESEIASGDTATTGNGEEVEYEVKPWEAKDKFRFFLCFVFAVGICIVAAFWGDPRERLKDKYKRARKQQAKEEKKRKEQEARQAKLEEEKKVQEEAEAWEEEMKAK